MGIVLPHTVVWLLDCSLLVPTKLMTVSMPNQVNILYFKYCVLHLTVFTSLVCSLHSALGQADTES